MKAKRTFGVVLLAIGVLTIFYANFQKERIRVAGAKAKEQIEQSSSIFQGNPVQQAVGASLTDSFKRKAAAEIARYDQMVQYLRIGGIIVATFGTGIVFFACRKKVIND